MSSFSSRAPVMLGQVQRRASEPISERRLRLQEAAFKSWIRFWMFPSWQGLEDRPRLQMRWREISNNRRKGGGKKNVRKTWHNATQWRVKRGQHFYYGADLQSAVSAVGSCSGLIRTAPGSQGRRSSGSALFAIAFPWYSREQLYACMGITGIHINMSVHFISDLISPVLHASKTITWSPELFNLPFFRFILKWFHVFVWFSLYIQKPKTTVFLSLFGIFLFLLFKIFFTTLFKKMLFLFLLFHNFKIWENNLKKTK